MICIHFNRHDSVYTHMNIHVYICACRYLDLLFVLIDKDLRIICISD